ncbi:response regulator [Compostibacter hankyongensis]
MGKRILVIDDNKDILDLMRYVLEGEGYSVITGRDSKPLRELHILCPDLILLDNRLADGSGGHFCQQLKADPSTRHLPVVLVSANTDLPGMATSCGADGYLSKPFNIRDLWELVGRFV